MDHGAGVDGCRDIGEEARGSAYVPAVVLVPVEFLRQIKHAVVHGLFLDWRLGLRALAGRTPNPTQHVRVVSFWTTTRRDMQQIAPG